MLPMLSMLDVKTSGELALIVLAASSAVVAGAGLLIAGAVRSVARHYRGLTAELQEGVALEFAPAVIPSPEEYAAAFVRALDEQQNEHKGY